MERQKLTLAVILIFVTAIATSSHAQSGLKKVRMGSSSTNVSFLALYTALNRGFFKDEGIDLEIVFMPANLASTAVLNGDIDYNGAVTGTIGAAVQGRPMKVLLFTVSKPLLFLMGQKNITDLKQLKGKKIAGSSPGGSATLLANQALKQIGLEPGKDVSVLQMSGNAASRYAVLESGVVDASLLSVPENIIAHGQNQCDAVESGDFLSQDEPSEEKYENRRGVLEYDCIGSGGQLISSNKRANGCGVSEDRGKNRPVQLPRAPP